MLSEHEIAEIDKEIAKFPQKRHACLDALMIVQKQRGYVSDEALSDVAVYLEMSPTELDGIATFYNLIYRKPVGRCVIRLCDSVCCHIMGYEEVRKSIKEHLGIDWGQTSADKQFTLLPAQCLGTCDHAPAMMINEKLYQNVDPKQVKDLVLSHAKEGLSHDATTHRVNEGGYSAAQLERI